VFKIFLNAWRVHDIRKKLLFIFLLLLIYRLGSAIPLPGIDLETLNWARYPGHFDVTQTLFQMITGGGIASLFAMGIAPYITASIIMQLLTYAIPQLKEMQKDGEDGRKKIGQITRYLSVALATLQASAMVFSYRNFHGSGVNLFRHPSMLVYIVAVMAMVTGTIFIMWLAELLTEKGIGNGASFLIFANILSQLPMGIMLLWDMATDATRNTFMNIGLLLVILIVFAAIIAFVVMVHEGERRIPVQYSKGAAGGRAMFGNQSSYIPLKVNIAGVLSIIFAVSLLQFPTMIMQFLPGQPPNWVDRVFGEAGWLQISGSNANPIGMAVYVVLIFAFTHFYTSFAVNPVEMAENMKKNGGFIPGIRPGKPTSEFIQVTVNRLSWIGSVFYSLIALTPILLEMIPQVPNGIGFGGTTLLIVIGVALEFIKQLESQLLMRHYKGFLS